MASKIIALAFFALLACAAAAVARRDMSQQAVRDYEAKKCQLKYKVCCKHSYVCGYEEKDYKKTPKYCDKEECYDEKYMDVKDEHYAPTYDDYKKMYGYDDKKDHEAEKKDHEAEKKDYGAEKKDYDHEKKDYGDEKKDEDCDESKKTY